MNYRPPTREALKPTLLEYFARFLKPHIPCTVAADSDLAFRLERIECTALKALI